MRGIWSYLSSRPLPVKKATKLIIDFKKLSAVKQPWRATAVLRSRHHMDPKKRSYTSISSFFNSIRLRSGLTEN